MKTLISILFATAFIASAAVAQSPVPKEVVHPYIAIKTETRRMNVMGPELSRLPRIVVTANDHDGRSSQYSGVELRVVLKMAGVVFGKNLRGPELAKYLLVEAADGYKAVFALPELDPEFTDRAILLADLKDGKPLSADAGPFQIIVAGEKRPARCVRQVTSLRIMTAVSPKE
jgi:hypothetical protein